MKYDQTNFTCGRVVVLGLNNNHLVNNYVVLKSRKLSWFSVQCNHYISETSFYPIVSEPHVQGAKQS